MQPKRKFARPSLKQLLFSSIGGTLTIFGIIFAVALYVVETLIRPKKKGIFDDYTFSPFELELPAEAVVFPSQDSGHNVSGWYIPREGATTTIIVCPGYRSQKSDALGMSAILWKAGHNVLAFEYYGHGTVVGKPITLGYREISDFMGAIAYAKEQAPQCRLGVVAYSMGAAVAIMCAARNNDVEAIIADSPFATHLSVVSYNVHRTLHLPPAPFAWLADYLMWVRAGYRFNQVEPIRDIAHISPRPILIIHGGKDSIVDPNDAPLLYKAADEPKELWVVPEADHCGAYFVDRSLYTRKVIHFFDQHLKQTHSPLNKLNMTELKTLRETLPEAS